jgi:hypothetical protein
VDLSIRDVIQAFVCESDHTADQVILHKSILLRHVKGQVAASQTGRDGAVWSAGRRIICRVLKIDRPSSKETKSYDGEYILYGP